MNKTHVNEIHWLRAIACLAVVSLHAITSGTTIYYPESFDKIGYILHIMQMGLMFGTPTFIFISEFLFAKNYKDGMPKGFFIKRLRYLGIPYVFMAMVYAIVFTENITWGSFTLETLKNIFIGDFVAYFILIIFQFYILHHILYKKLQNLNPKIPLIIAFLINSLYLAFFNFTSPPNNEIMEYIWTTGHWLPFPGWVFYFILGFYCGKNYKEFLLLLNNRKNYLFLFFLVSFIGMIILKYFGLPSITSSKRIDIIFYTTSVIFLVLYYSSKIKYTPKFIFKISKYSFSIYLLHKLITDTVGSITNNVITHIIILFVISLLFSISVSFIINLIPFGKYLVGNLGKTPIQANQLVRKRKGAVNSRTL
ncbi:acyltransferase family protein [Priestia endophytica]|uniref:Membrane-bound acyltransferase YfiQ, involved in biofilm formation n=1 Tax=Priestia endophytica DSM 13796 TaxID=1121089 RepID=A0A1I6AA29_9BACI|nr:acyltransferase family protein [Priestia endophytica]KYG27291.1 hypothetical protein AZF06_13810 [Priestia endophytica]SFQ65529.1 Membrane-bound acyltransferase YfiQ, involved in biofilm formation [Priestia endophytica DSM 13796]